MVPTQFHRLLAPARGGAGEVRRVVDPLHGPRRRAVPARREAPHDRVVGRLDHGVLRGTEGGGTIVTPQEWLRSPGTVGSRLAGSEIASTTTRATAAATDRRAPSTCRLALADFEYEGRTRPRPNENRTEGFFTVGDWGLLDEDG
jgi:long-chain acyl-CoA synthetase